MWSLQTGPCAFYNRLEFLNMVSALALLDRETSKDVLRVYGSQVRFYFWPLDGAAVPCVSGRM